MAERNNIMTNDYMNSMMTSATANSKATTNEDELDETLDTLEDEMDNEMDNEDDVNSVDNEDNEGTIISPLKAIRAKCLDCCCGQRLEVKLCTATTCPLYAFRMGKNPYKKGRTFTEEQKIAAGERMKKAREARLGKKDEE